MTPGEWIAFGSLVLTLNATIIGAAWFVGAKLVRGLQEFHELRCAVDANTQARVNDRAALDRHTAQIEALARGLATLQGRVAVG